MTTLHLGVIDVPYGDEAAAPTKKGQPRKRRGQLGVSTGDVATFLEDKYHVMEHFFELHGEEIAADLSESVAGALETALMGGPALDSSGLAAAMTKIEERFKRMLSEKELERLGYPGVPTKAALHGVSHRFKHPYAKRGPRPSFVDTGLYQSSFKAWVD